MNYQVKQLNSSNQKEETRNLVIHFDNVNKQIIDFLISVIYTIPIITFQNAFNKLNSLISNHSILKQSLPENSKPTFISNYKSWFKSYYEQAKENSKLKKQIRELKTQAEQDHFAFVNTISEMRSLLSISKSNFVKEQNLISLRKRHFFNKNVNSNPKILIYGVSAINNIEITSLLKKKLSLYFNIELEDSDITLLTSDKKSDLKNISPVEALKSQRYDYLIIGPHPHSVKGKNIKHSWSRFLEVRGIQTLVFERYHKPLSKDWLRVLSNEIGIDVLNQSRHSQSLNVA